MFNTKTFSLLALAFVFTGIVSCKKSAVVADKKIDQSAIAAKLAQNFVKSVTGEYGTNVSKGSNMKVAGDSRCGTQIDSAVNYSYGTPGIADVVVTGHFNFKYLCDETGSNTIGYILTDSTRSLSTSSEYDFLSVVKQNYTVIGQTLSSLLTNGTQESHFTQTSKSPEVKSYHQDNYFVLKNIIPVPFLRTIASGSADYIIDGNEEGVAYHYEGVMYFKGSYLVWVQMGNVTYEVNLILGTTKVIS